jgi:hypothetical protein
MMQLQAQAERWVSLTGSDGKVKARLNLETGELVIRDRGVNHKWPLRTLLEGHPVQQREGLQSP